MTGLKKEDNVRVFPGHAIPSTPYCSVTIWKQNLSLKRGFDHIERTEELNDREWTHPWTDFELRLKLVFPIGIRIGGSDGLEQFTLVLIPDVLTVMEPLRYRVVGGNWSNRWEAHNTKPQTIRTPRTSNVAVVHPLWMNGGSERPSITDEST